MEAERVAPVDLEGFRTSMEAAGIGEIVDVTVDVYLDEASSLFQQLVGAAAEGDMGTVEARAHTLKSSSANVWANRVSAMFAEVEGAARDGASESVASAMDALRAEFDAVVRYLSEGRASR